MVGQQIGKYRVTRQVGRGGMGTVYRAVDETLHRDVAIKVLNTGLDDPTVARRFRAEAIAVARLNHPGLAAIYELVPHDDQWLMVMEFVRGETLEHLLSASGPLVVARAADLTMQLLAALAHAHGMGVIHRDLKPANIMLTDGGALKVMDFGIARVTGAEQLTSAGFMMGTPAYMAPEQVLGGEVDARTDLYAVGILLFQMVTGALPFGGATPVQAAQARISEPPASLATLRPDLPGWISQVVDVALSRDVSRRFPSAAAFREAVRRGLAGLPIEVPHVGAEAVSLTAAPGALRVVAKNEKAPERPRSATPSEVAGLTLAGEASERPSEAVESADGRARALSPAVIAGVVLVSLAIAAATWVAIRPASTSLPEQEAGTPSIAPPAAGDAVEPVSPPSASPIAGSPPAGPGSRSAAPPVAPPFTPPSGSPSSPAVIGSSSPSAPPTPASAPAVPATAGPSSAIFRGVRAFMVSGRRAQERPAVLAFTEGAVTLFDESGATRLATMPYRQVTSAAYTRDRDPRWYPTLAGPPADVDMPGGMFRGDRHWLALQSRDSWMIVRMNDGDWRSITEAVTTFLGRKVEELRP